MADPDLYRTKEEIEEWKKRDPIVLFQTKLTEWGLLIGIGPRRIESEVAAEIEDAVRFAEASPREPVEDLLEGRLESGERHDQDDLSRSSSGRHAKSASKRIRASFLMGEDVGGYGGAFAVSLGLLEGIWAGAHS